MRIVRTLGRTLRLLAALVRTDVVVSYLTPYLLLAALVQCVRPQLKIVTLRYRLGPKRRGLGAWIDRLKVFAYRRVDRIACLVPSQIDAFSARYGVHPEQLSWLPFGVDTKFFSPGRSSKRKPFVIVPGNHRRDESAVFELARAGGVRIVRVSNAPWVREAYLPALRDDPDLGRWLSFEINVPAKRLRELYRQASAAWLPLIESDEPAGLTAALEAAACGCSLIITPGLTTEVLDRLGIGYTAYQPVDSLILTLHREIVTPPDDDAVEARVQAVRKTASVEVASRVLREQIELLVTSHETNIEAYPSRRMHPAAKPPNDLPVRSSARSSPAL